MYTDTLTITAENVLAFLLNNLEASYSIREIARAIGQDYKIVFTTIKALAKDKLVTVKRVSNINQCSAALTQENTALFTFVSQRYAAKKVPKRVWSALQDATNKIKNPYYTLLLFGSYAKGNVKPTSDVDVLFIVANRSQEGEIDAAVKTAATLNNLKISPVILTLEEFKSALKEQSVAREAYRKHLIIKGGELFYSSHA